ncbi:MAG: type II toxin-antitoxin system death-on-curing family toxin [Verrucomicrobia bacterium]|nr:type II toxin-antitoxin system death-on-curing family toxin [Verrucomicrobiota bacterium]
MPIWLESREIRFFHQQLIEEHGGLHGLRDEGALDSTLARPRHLLAYHPDSTIHKLAATYGFDFARNHVFVDGNKRIALAAVNVFLQINGANLAADEAEAVIIINEVAGGAMKENDFADWISARSASFDLDAE